MAATSTTASPVHRLAERFMPHRFLAAQLRRPSGRFGRWVMTRGLNRGNAELIHATLDALALQRSDSFMDIGFGGGLALELAAARSDSPLWGIDFSPDVVAAGARRLEALVLSGRLNLISADVADLPLRDAMLSAICTTNTIYFWPEPERALASLYRVLQPGGRLAIGYVGAAKMAEFSRLTRHGFTPYAQLQVEELMHACGFREIQSVALAGAATRGDFTTVGVVP
jgi:ubiquinone/menaquinone biosynthesis C-methylase UbiE